MCKIDPDFEVFPTPIFFFSVEEINYMLNFIFSCNHGSGISPSPHIMEALVLE